MDLDIRDIHSTVDMIRAATTALQERDIDTLEKLVNLVQGWLQLESETEAQVELLESMIEVLYDLEAAED